MEVDTRLMLFGTEGLKNVLVSESIVDTVNCRRTVVRMHWIMAWEASAQGPIECRSLLAVQHDNKLMSSAAHGFAGWAVRQILSND